MPSSRASFARIVCAAAVALGGAVALRSQLAPPAATPLEDAFVTGWMLADTNGDGLADFINGKIVVPADPTSTENTAAADFAARLGYGTTGLTPPLVVTRAEGSPRILVGRAASVTLPVPLEKDEGAVAADGSNLAVIGDSANALLAAAEGYSARAPYQWRVPGPIVRAIADALHAQLTAVTYLHGKAGIHRAFLRSNTPVAAADLEAALAGAPLAGVHGLVVTSGETTVSATSSRAEANLPAGGGGAGRGGAVAAATGGAAAADASAEAPGAAGGNAPAHLDLATLYTSRGLFTGASRMPLPSTLNAHLYVPAGAAGVAMANLAARMGLETTGIALPLASPIESAAAAEVRSQAVLAGDAPLAREAEAKLRINDSVAAQSETALAAGEGEARVVDDAFGRRAALLTRGDAAGASAALELLANRFPNLWEQGKQHLSVEEIRYDLHRFFSLHSGAGQAAAALYHLDEWTKTIDCAGIENVKAEVYVDVADPKLGAVVKDLVEERLHTTAAVEAASLHAGSRCCQNNPPLHLSTPGVEFRQDKPDFAEDIKIPWEGSRLIEAVKRGAAKLPAGQPVKVVARVSEGPGERRKLQQQIEQILTQAGADPKKLSVEVLCSYKQGYSWLMDEVAPALAGKPVKKIVIDFARNVDASGIRTMQSEARWVQELYPVDEMLARKLNLPLENVTLNEIEEPPANGPTYRVHAFDAAGKEMLERDFKVTTVMQPYNGVIPRYEQVQVNTGWLRVEAGGKALVDERVKTDIEEFWDHYQNKTLPRIYQFIMAQAHGELRPEFAPPFDTLTLDIHLSEPDYSLDLDKERISTLEALQEDTFYSTGVFFSMMGDLEAGRPISYTGRIIPIVHGSEDGKDGSVHIAFYGKKAANPLVRLTWTDAHGKHQKRERNLPAVTGEMQPRLIQAKVKAGAEGVERLGWLLPADFKDDQYDDWLKVEGQDQVDRSIFSVAKARGQMHWIEEMHKVGAYRDDLAYPHLKEMTVEFDLPLDLHAKPGSPAPREFAALAIVPPGTTRPMIAAVKPRAGDPIVQWDDPISPAENASILARFATFPGVNVYWMGRSYLGENIWAADVTLPTPALLRSWAKETTLKASIVYSGRQHANEVSSTSHIDKLAEELLTDPAKRALLKQVNVVLHPITNPDGAQLSVDLYKITPDNLLHPGYHGSLSADVSSGQGETDPIYPESRTRKQLIDAWLPDAFLNPHGYPSHEWVQPFSEYTGWVQSRQGANSGRAWWIPRGWFTSMGYLRDEQHPNSKQVAYAIQDRIVEAERGVPGLLPLEDRMNARYERFGQRWQPRDMYQPIVNGIRIYMSLKGSGGGGRGGAGGGGGAAGGEAGGSATPGSGGVSGLNSDVTWDAAYTEAPDETAHGDYMKLMASAGLAFDYVHLRYLADNDLRISRTEREAGGIVTWRVERPRPVLPKE